MLICFRGLNVDLLRWFLFSSSFWFSSLFLFSSSFWFWFPLRRGFKSLKGLKGVKGE